MEVSDRLHVGLLTSERKDIAGRKYGFSCPENKKKEGYSHVCLMDTIIADNKGNHPNLFRFFISTTQMPRSSVCNRWLYHPGKRLTVESVAGFISAFISPWH
jgi:hypothetical protein